MATSVIAIRCTVTPWHRAVSGHKRHLKRLRSHAYPWDGVYQEFEANHQVVANVDRLALVFRPLMNL